MDERPLPLLSDLLRPPATHWRRLLVGALIGALVGAALYWALPERYYATSRIAVSPQLVYLSLNEVREPEESVTLDTTAALLGSDVALAAVAEAMDLTPDEARTRMAVSAKPLSRTLVVQVRGDSRPQAVAGATAATESLLTLQSEAFALEDERVRALKNRVAVLRAQAQERVAEGSPSTSLGDLVHTLETRLDRAIATNNTSSVVIQRAAVARYRPGQLVVFVVSGLTIGLVLALLSTRLTARSAVPTPGRTTGRRAQR